MRVKAKFVSAVAAPNRFLVFFRVFNAVFTAFYVVYNILWRQKRGYTKTQIETVFGLLEFDDRHAAFALAVHAEAVFFHALVLP